LQELAKVIHAQIVVDGLSMTAYHVLNAAFECAMSDGRTAVHKVPLDDFYRRASLAESTPRVRFKQIVEDAKVAVVEFDGIDTDHLDKDAQRLGCWPAFGKTAVTETHFEFEFCRQLGYDQVFFSGYWRSVNDESQ
jgi:hypothetical protein